MVKAQNAEWEYLRKELSRRMHEPTGRVGFVIYFFIGVVIFGGLGWVILLCRYYFQGDMKVVSELPSSLSTFFLALLASAMVDIVLTTGGSAENSSTQGVTNGFRVFTLGLSLLCILLAYAGFQSSQTIWTYIASILGLIISLFLWWVLNADSAKWQDRLPQAIDATGGTTTVELKGTTDGLIV